MSVKIIASYETYIEMELGLELSCVMMFMEPRLTLQMFGKRCFLISLGCFISNILHSNFYIVT